MAERRRFVCMLSGAAIGFALAFFALAWGRTVLPSQLATAMQLLTMPSAILLALPVGLVFNWYMGQTDILLMSCLAWAGFGAILGFAWYRHYSFQYETPGTDGQHQTTERPFVRFLGSSALWAARFAGLVVAGWIVLFVVSFPFGICAFSPAVNSILSPDLDAVSNSIGVIFPASTRLRYSYEAGFQDADSIEALLDIDRDDIPRLLSALPAPRNTSSTDRFGIADGHGRDCPQWWRPDSVRDFAAAQSESKGDLRILVSLDNPRRARVYLEWCGDRW